MLMALPFQFLLIFLPLAAGIGEGRITGNAAVHKRIWATNMRSQGESAPGRSKKPANPLFSVDKALL